MSKREDQKYWEDHCGLFDNSETGKWEHLWHQPRYIWDGQDFIINPEFTGQMPDDPYAEGGGYTNGNGDYVIPLYHLKKSATDEDRTLLKKNKDATKAFLGYSPSDILRDAGLNFGGSDSDDSINLSERIETAKKVGEIEPDKKFGFIGPFSKIVFTVEDYTLLVAALRATKQRHRKRQAAQVETEPVVAEPAQQKPQAEVEFQADQNEDPIKVITKAKEDVARALKRVQLDLNAQGEELKIDGHIGPVTLDVMQNRRNKIYAQIEDLSRKEKALDEFLAFFREDAQQNDQAPSL